MGLAVKDYGKTDSSACAACTKMDGVVSEQHKRPDCDGPVFYVSGSQLSAAYFMNSPDKKPSKAPVPVIFWICLLAGAAADL